MFFEHRFNRLNVMEVFIFVKYVRKDYLLFSAIDEHSIQIISLLTRKLLQGKSSGGWYYFNTSLNLCLCNESKIDEMKRQEVVSFWIVSGQSFNTGRF